MTASEGSFIGFARQTNGPSGATDYTVADDAKFKYLLFTEGMMGPQNMTLPLDREVGGGALPRGMVKTGILSGGQMAIIPRPDTLGMFLLGATGSVASAANGAAYDHVFKLNPADHFDAPYYTARFAPGGMWGEVYRDLRFNQLGLEWRGANFVRGSIGMLGGKPTPNVTRAAWGELAKVDGGPQFLAPVSTIELPTGSPIKVLNGQFACGMDIPLDEQWIVGSYHPDAMDLTARQFMLTLTVKVTDRTLYEKMNYDPALGGAWAASIFREANVLLSFKSDVEADTGVPYELKVQANGQSHASGDGNVFWSARLNGLRAGRQVTMTVTGLFAADPTGGDPITFTLTNQRPDYLA